MSNMDVKLKLDFLYFYTICAEIWSLRNSLSGEKAYCV